jgi:hypothetical protein
VGGSRGRVPGVVELATDVSPAGHANHVRPSAELIVPGERISLEITREAFEEPLRTVAGVTRREVVHAVGIPGVAEIDPEPPGSRPGKRRVPDRHRGTAPLGGGRWDELQGVRLAHDHVRVHREQEPDRARFGLGNSDARVYHREEREPQGFGRSLDDVLRSRLGPAMRLRHRVERLQLHRPRVRHRGSPGVASTLLLLSYATGENRAAEGAATSNVNLYVASGPQRFSEWRESLPVAKSRPLGRGVPRRVGGA